MFERPKSGERTALVHLYSNDDHDEFEELRDLASSAGAEILVSVTGRRHTPDPRYYVGKGKLEEIAAAVQQHDIQLVLFNHPLTPSQERNLERALNARVVDRTGLILDIFAQRAQSFEGKLQVELAQLRHLSTRLVRGWTHLERQKGGIGLRGPGETQLETDKRLLADRIRQIQKRLDKVDRQRHQGRVARRRAGAPVVALVGYTNAGKSTLFNALTRAGTYAADQLFATLDPMLRRHAVAGRLEVILADTVGFIRQLPHELIAAFRSTLREASESDLLVHVIDAGDELATEKIAQVDAVLAEIGADGVERILVYNKIDTIPELEPRAERDESGRISRIWLSARSGTGLNLLDQALAEYFGGPLVRSVIHIGPTDAALRAKLYRLGRVLRDETDELGGWVLEVEMDQRHWLSLGDEVADLGTDGPHEAAA
ncbi:MAG: ribosome rescue GTPase HflX [Methylotetracoccus sp.]